MSTPLDRLVIGGGIGGLAAAWAAHRAGLRVQVLEARPEPGGVLRTENVDGYRLELGASSLPSTARSVQALMEEVPGAPDLVPAASSANRQYLWRPAGLVPVPRTPPDLLRSPLLGPGAKLRLLAEWIRPRRPAGASPHESLATFITRRLGRSVTEVLLRPFVGGIHGAAPERMGAADAFPALVALEQRHGGLLRGLARAGRGRARREVRLVAGGMAALPRAIATALGRAVETGVRVSRLTPASEGPGMVAHAEDGRTWHARETWLAVPASAQASLVAAVDADAADRLGAIPHVPMAVVHVGWPPGGGPALPPGFGFLTSRAPDARILGAAFRSRLAEDLAPPGHALVTTYVGGSEDAAALALPDAQLRTGVLEDLARALGGRIRPDLVHIHRWPRAIPLAAPGHRGRMASLQARLAPWGIRLGGSHVTGVSVEHCVAAARPVATVHTAD